MKPVTIPVMLASLSVRHAEGKFWKPGVRHAVESITLSEMPGATAFVQSAKTRCGIEIAYPQLSDVLTPDCKRCGR